MDPFQRLIALALLLGPGAASAVYTNAVPPPEVVNTANSWIANASASSRFTAGVYAGEAVATGAAATANMGFTARVAAGAGRVLVTAARAAVNPYVAIPITAAYLCSEIQMCWDAASNVWVKTPWVQGTQFSGPPAGGGSGTIWYSTLGDACQARTMWWVASNPLQPPYSWSNVSGTPSGIGPYACTVRATRQPDGQQFTQNFSVGTRPGLVPGQPHTANPGDWEQAEDEIEAKPPESLPDDALNEQAKPYGIPIEVPALDPGTVAVPTGEPYPDPNADPDAPWRQPFVEFKPAPTTGNPWRVDYRPTERDADNPDTPGDETQDPAEPGTGGKEETPDLCALNPDIVACQKLGDLEAQDVPTQVVTLAITPDSGWATAGACPADKVVQTHFVSVTVPFGLLCDAADMSRPVVIGVAWVIAMMLFLGISRREA